MVYVYVYVYAVNWLLFMIQSAHAMAYGYARYNMQAAIYVMLKQPYIYVMLACWLYINLSICLGCDMDCYTNK